MNRNLAKKIGKFFIISLLVYTGISLGLIFWPINRDKNTENYDYSGIEEAVSPKLGDELWVETKNNYKLFNRIYPSSSDDVMILVHGSGSDSRYLSDLANQIADEKIATVLTPDMRGHGRNTGEKGYLDYIGQLEDDMKEIISYCKKELEAKNIILAGHSSGGGFVLRYIGNTENTKIDKAILLSPYLGHKSKAAKPNSGGWVQIALPRIIGLSMLNNIGLSSLNHLPVLFFNRPDNINDDLQSPHYSYNMTMNFNPDNSVEEIKNLSTPSLVLVGREDESFFPEEFPIAFEAAAEYTEVAIIEDAKHLDIVQNKKAFQLIKNWNNK